MRKWLSELRKFSPVTSKSFILPFSFSPLSSRIIRFYAFAHLLIFIRVICSLAFSCNFSPSIKPSRHLHVSPSEIHCASRHTSCTLPRYLHTHTHTTPPATNCSALHSECVQIYVLRPSWLILQQNYNYHSTLPSAIFYLFFYISVDVRIYFEGVFLRLLCRTDGELQFCDSLFRYCENIAWNIWMNL